MWLRAAAELPESEPAASSSAWIWILIAAGIAAALLIGWLARKKKTAVPPPTRSGSPAAAGTAGTAPQRTPIAPENAKAMFRLISDVAEGLRKSSE